MRVRQKIAPCLAWLAVTGGACASALAGPPATTGPQRVVSLKELARVWSRPTPQLPVRPTPFPADTARGDALKALLGGRDIHSRCATPLLIALYQNAGRLNQPTRALVDQLTRPTQANAGGEKLSPGGEFRVHFSTDPSSIDRVDPYDGDLSGVPDGVERLAATLTDTWADLAHQLDWAPGPSPDGASTVDVFLVGGFGEAGAHDGFVMPRGSAWSSQPGPAATTSESADGALYLDSGLARPSAASREAIAHLIAHLALIRESVRESTWWHEASATWLESRLERNAAAIAREFAETPGGFAARGLSDDQVGLSLEAFLWPHYLSQSTSSDSAVLRNLWEEMASVPGNNTFDAMDRVLRRMAGTSLAEEIRVFNIWNLFLGQANEGRHYPFAGFLPTLQGDATFEVFPARGGSLAGPVAPLGSALVRMLGDGSQGGLRIRFFGGEPAEWDVSLIVHGAGEATGARHVQVELDASGRAFVPVPWRRLSAIDLLIQNLASPATAAADYYFSIDYDPSVPFDLLTFTAEDTGHGAALAWSTEDEERLVGWNIFRGHGPLGPFSRINRYPVPGAGQAGQPMSYMYLDSSVDPGGKYYYYLEGVTLDGFTETSHPAGVRLGRPSPSQGAAR